jgi:hypothetical protein
MKIEIDLETEVREDHTVRDLLIRLVAGQKHINSQLHKIMITQDVLQKSVDNLKAAVDAAIAALPPNTPASTPDSAVLQFQSNVDAQTARLVAAESTATPNPTPAPAPAPVPSTP